MFVGVVIQQRCHTLPF